MHIHYTIVYACTLAVHVSRIRRKGRGGREGGREGGRGGREGGKGSKFR